MVHQLHGSSTSWSLLVPRDIGSSTSWLLRALVLQHRAPEMSHRGERAARCLAGASPWSTMDRVLSPPGARARASPALGGLRLLYVWRERVRHGSSETLQRRRRHGSRIGPLPPQRHQSQRWACFAGAPGSGLAHQGDGGWRWSFDYKLWQWVPRGIGSSTSRWLRAVVLHFEGG